MTAPVVCPQCGGPCWDNRGDKKSLKAPDFRCKDRAHCDGAVWLDKAKGVSKSGPVADRAAPGTPAGKARTLCADYLTVTDFVLNKVVPRYTAHGITVDAQACAAIVATLVISRQKQRG